MTERERAECVRVCAACAAACERAAEYCRARGAGYDDRGRVAALINCAAVARTFSDYAERESELAERAAEILVAVCHRGAALCAEFDDEPLTECGRLCLAAADCSQRVLAGHAFER